MSTQCAVIVPPVGDIIQVYYSVELRIPRNNWPENSHFNCSAQPWKASLMLPISTNISNSENEAKWIRLVIKKL